jgi:hypothetical protein
MAERVSGAPAEGEAMDDIGWNRLTADEYEELEKMMAPYRAIEDQSREAGTKSKRGGTIGHSAMRVLEAFFVFMLRRPGESLRLSYEAIGEAALLSPRTVGRTIQHLADLGLITVHGGKVYEINLPPKVTPAAELGSRPPSTPERDTS